MLTLTASERERSNPGERPQNALNPCAETFARNFSEGAKGSQAPADELRKLLLDMLARATFNGKAGVRFASPRLTCTLGANASKTRRKREKRTWAAD